MSWRKSRRKEINGEAIAATRESGMEGRNGDREKRIDSRGVLQIGEAEVAWN